MICDVERGEPVKLEVLEKILIKTKLEYNV